MTTTPETMTPIKLPPRIRPALTMIAALILLALSLTLSGTLPLFGSQLEPPRHYYYQPENRIYLGLLDGHERNVTEIIRQRMQKLWGPDATRYLPALTDKPYHGYYQSDSLLSQRRAIWRSSLFAKDLDFIEVSLSTFDGLFSLRETYAINRNDKRWVVIDSAGFPLFERIIEISEDDLENQQGLRDFLLTLLSYAGYGSYDILSSPDTIYHGIDLGEELDDDYYPFESVSHGDTTETTFTCCLRDGVEVSRWRIKYFGDGLLIDESEQLVTYEDLPEEDTDSSLAAGEIDTSRLAGLLSDVTNDSGAGARDTMSDSSQAVTATGPSPGGDIRLADLLSGQVKAPTASGHVSYEILSAKLVLPNDSTMIESIPEFRRFVEPTYPPRALLQRAEGEVEILLRVDSLGKPHQIMISESADKKVGFELSAKTAAGQCSFRPGTSNGSPVDMWLTYKLLFKLSGSRFKANVPPAPDSAKVDSTLKDTTKIDTARSDTMINDTTVADTTLTDTTSSDTASSDTSSSDTVPSDTTPSDTTAVDTMPTDTMLTDTIKSDSVGADSAKAQNDSTSKSAPSDTISDTTSDTTGAKKDTSAAKDTTKSD